MHLAHPGAKGDASELNWIQWLKDYLPKRYCVDKASIIDCDNNMSDQIDVAACIALYFKSYRRENYRLELIENESKFYNEKAFIIFSFGVSGIQRFIYSISSKGALKGLRARSFYLEILLENIVDEILSACSLSRANLLYNGGGQANLILPNTDESKDKAQSKLKAINRSLINHFGAELFIAYCYQDCSANELMSTTDDPESYSNIFRSLAAQTTAMKLRRYEPDDLRNLNRDRSNDKDRECAVCGASGSLVDYFDNIMCETCAAFAGISGVVIKPDAVFFVTREKTGEVSLPLFSGEGIQWFCAISATKADQFIKSNSDKIVRLYKKNMLETGPSLSTKIWLGDYAATSDDGAIKTFEELAESSEGLERIGILRADVDNLGSAFTGGFIRNDNGVISHQYMTLSRTAALSRSLSIFFKHYINSLLEKPEFNLTEKNGPKNAVIVYSGGDDMFIAGAWDEVLSIAVDLQKVFTRYTGGSLTLSAGFGIFDPKYPISTMAVETAFLETAAKNNRHNDTEKNSISLFGLEVKDGHLTDRHTYDWKSFEDHVLREKYLLIKELFGICGDWGNTFLHNILYFLMQVEKENINIARLAYLLARSEPKKDASDHIKKAYSSFSAKVYKWALDSEERQQLITAIILFVYTRRDTKEEVENG